MVREAQVPLVFGAPPLGFGAPVRYNAPNCTVVNDTITRQECIPRYFLNKFEKIPEGENLLLFQEE